MITACTSAIDTQLAGLPDLMQLLGATASSSGMDTALTRASAWAERYITNDPGVLVRREVVSETVRGTGSPRLMLSRTPVLRIQRLFDTTDTGTAKEYCSTDIRIEDAESGFLELTGDRGFDWTQHASMLLDTYPRPNAPYRPWLVVYEAGWQFACTSSTSSDWLTTTTGRTLPEDISQAVLLKAMEFYEGSADPVRTIKVGPLSANYSSQDQDPVRDLLDPYRRW